MFSKVLNSNLIVNLFLIPIVGIILWGSTWANSVDYSFLNSELQMPLFKLIPTITGGSFWSGVWGYILIVINALLIVRLNSMLLFLQKPTYIPGYIYLFINGAFPSLHNLIPQQCAVFFMLWACFHFLNHRRQNSYPQLMLNGSFLCGIASLFYAPLLLLLPYLWIVAVMLRDRLHIRSILIPLLGFLFPWGLYWAFTFLLSDDTNSIVLLVKDNLTWNPGFICQNTALGFGLSFIGFYFFIGLMCYLRIKDMMSIEHRTGLSVIYWLLPSLVLIPLLFNIRLVESFALLSLPCSYMISEYFVFSRNHKVIKEGLLIILILGTLLFPYIYKLVQ